MRSRVFAVGSRRNDHPCISRSFCSTADCGILTRATWGPTSGEVAAHHRSDEPTACRNKRPHHADKPSDGTSRHLRVSIIAEATTCDLPPRLSPWFEPKFERLDLEYPILSSVAFSDGLDPGTRLPWPRTEVDDLSRNVPPVWFTRTEVRFSPSRACLSVSSQPKLQRRSRHRPRFLHSTPKSFGILSRRRSYSQAPLSRLLFCDLN